MLQAERVECSSIGLDFLLGVNVYVLESARQGKAKQTRIPPLATLRVCARVLSAHTLPSTTSSPEPAMKTAVLSTLLLAALQARAHGGISTNEEDQKGKS